MSKVLHAQGLSGCSAEPVPHPADRSGVTLGVTLGPVSVNWSPQLPSRRLAPLPRSIFPAYCQTVALLELGWEGLGTGAEPLPPSTSGSLHQALKIYNHCFDF